VHRASRKQYVLKEIDLSAAENKAWTARLCRRS
jgi:hypothetical protein